MRKVLLAVAATALLSSCGSAGGGQDSTAAPAASASPGSPSGMSAVSAVINRSSPQEDVLVAYSCGATLVAPAVVLTAAHCVDDRPAEGLDVIVGAGNLCAPDDIDGERIHVRSVEIHPLADERRTADVALLHLDRPAAAAPMPIASADSGEDVSVEAWGHYGPQQPVPCTRRVTTLATLPGDACRAAGARATRPYNNRLHICAAPVKDAAHNTCGGDSGAGLLGRRDGAPVLLGVVSWGPSCKPEDVGVYARASAHSAWLRASAVVADARDQPHSPSQPVPSAPGTSAAPDEASDAQRG